MEKAGSSVHHSDHHTSAFPRDSYHTWNRNAIGILAILSLGIILKAFKCWDLIKINVTASTRTCLSEPSCLVSSGVSASACCEECRPLLTWFVLSPQFYPALTVHHQCKCQHSGRDKSRLSIIMKIILTSGTSCSRLGAARGPQTPL